MPPSPKEMKLPKSGDEICVVTKTYRSIHPPKIGTMNESLRNIWLKVGFFPQGADGDANAKSEKVIPSSVNFSNFEVHLSYKRCNLHSSMFNDIQFELVVWKSLELILLEFVGIAFSKKNVSSEYERRLPKSPSKPHTKTNSWKSEKPYPLIHPSKFFMNFPATPPTRTSKRTWTYMLFTTLVVLLTSRDPLFSWKNLWVASLQGTIRPQTLADCNHPAMKPASFLSSCGECFLVSLKLQVIRAVAGRT